MTTFPEEDLELDNATLSSLLYHNLTNSDISLIVQQVLNADWNNISLVSLTAWHRAQLTSVKSAAGVHCYIEMWFNYLGFDELETDLYCNAYYDGVYCWPHTLTGTITKRLCSEAFKQTRPEYADHLEGNAIRVCQDNGTWLWGAWTNYNECANSYEIYEQKQNDKRQLVFLVQHMLFFGSIFSLVCLGTALVVFYHFKSLWCDRITVQVHLMFALVLRFIMLLVITEPFVLNRSSNYREVDAVCKAVIAIYLYATVSSVSWMLIQGVYLNSKLTTSVFSGDNHSELIKYCCMGWIVPAILLSVYLAMMVAKEYEEKCWRGYAEMREIWILLGPMVFALLFNAIILLNILRIVLEKARNPNLQSAGKATIILFPVLGINNLLLLYNPGGEYEKYYVLLNTLFGSTQGIFVSIVYCFNSSEVHDAIRRSYNRFSARRSVARMVREQSHHTSSTRPGWDADADDDDVGESTIAANANPLHIHAATGATAADTVVATHGV